SGSTTPHAIASASPPSPPPTCSAWPRRTSRPTASAGSSSVPRADSARRAGAALGLAALLAAVPADAAKLALSESDQAQALRFGQRSTTMESWDAEWRVSNGSGDSVVVITPFHRLVVAGRNAAFKNEPVKPQDQEKMLAD